MATRTTSDHPSKKDIKAATGAAAKRGEDVGQAATDAATENVSLTTEAAVDTAMIGSTEVMQVAQSSGRAVLEGMTKIQQEIVDFVSKRIRHNIETQQDLLHCRNFGDLREVQSRFFRTAMEQYTSETKQLMELTREMVQRSADRDA